MLVTEAPWTSPTADEKEPHPFRVRDADFRVVGIGARLGEDLDATTFMKDAGGSGHAVESAPSVSWQEFLAFLESVGADCGFRPSIKKVAADAIETDGREAFSNLLRGSGRIEPPFVTMLRTTLRLLYEGKWIEVDWNGAGEQNHA